MAAGLRVVRISLSSLDYAGSCMNKNDIDILCQYDRWANERVVKALRSLSAEQFTRDLGGSFRSVRETILHVLSGKWIWLQYWKDPPASPEALSKLRARRDVLFNSHVFPDVAAVETKWAEVEQEQIEFVNSLSDDSLQQLLPFRSSQIRLVFLIQHVANHSTYHRGQVAFMMRQLGAEPAATDFHVFMAECQPNEPKK